MLYMASLNDWGKEQMTAFDVGGALAMTMRYASQKQIHE